jgi:hypothetical protein
MEASCVHGQVGAFYASCAGEGNQILQMKLSQSVESIHGHSKTAPSQFSPTKNEGF